MDVEAIYKAAGADARKVKRTVEMHVFERGACIGVHPKVNDHQAMQWAGAETDCGYYDLAPAEEREGRPLYLRTFHELSINVVIQSAQSP